MGGCDSIVVLLAAAAGRADGEKREKGRVRLEKASNESKNPERSPPIAAKSGCGTAEAKQTDAEPAVDRFLREIKAPPQRDERASIASLRRSNNRTPHRRRRAWIKAASGRRRKKQQVSVSRSANRD